MEPLISVLILTYNQEDTISQAIESVLDQQCEFPYEIIIADDASSDSTTRICREYADKYPERIRLRTFTENKGIVENYFDALISARGKYIADCAGDDYWIDPGKLQKQVKLLESHPEVSMVHAGWNYLDSLTGEISDPVPPSGEFTHRKPFLNGRDLLVPYIVSDEAPIPLIHLSSALFRKSVFDKAFTENPQHFLNPQNNCEDVSVISAMLAGGKVAFIEDKVLNYRVGHSSITSAENPAKNFDFGYGVLLLKFKLIEFYDIPEALDHPAFKNSTHYLLAMAFKSRSEERMKKLLVTFKKYGVKLSVKGKIYKFLSGNRLLWRVASKLKGSV